MKIKPDHYQELKVLIERFLKEKPEYIPLALQNGLSKTRICLDVFHYISFYEGIRPFNWDNLPLNSRLYDYMNDNHIETAVYNILKDLKIII